MYTLLCRLCINALCGVAYSTVQYSTVQYSTVQYSTVQYSTVQYSTVYLKIVQNSSGWNRTGICYIQRYIDEFTVLFNIETNC